MLFNFKQLTQVNSKIYYCVHPNLNFMVKGSYNNYRTIPNRSTCHNRSAPPPFLSRKKKSGGVVSWPLKRNHVILPEYARGGSVITVSNKMATPIASGVLSNLSQILQDSGTKMFYLA